MGKAREAPEHREAPGSASSMDEDSQGLYEGQLAPTGLGQTQWSCGHQQMVGKGQWVLVGHAG